ncbi:MAG: hypothetical protein O3A85_14090 [Proteobacteria bacterium]|nr:hypothetical protein [Pseudomonadota bacterium]
MLKSTLVWPSTHPLARLSTVVIIFASLILIACAPGAGPMSRSDASGKSPSAGAAKQQAAQVEYSDIPVPKGRKINVDKTVIVGTDIWYGQLTFDTSHSAESMFEFYTRELPNYGWRKITSARAQTSILAYDRQNRVMTMAIQPNRIRGSEVMITVSPREKMREEANPFTPPSRAGTPAPAPMIMAPPAAETLRPPSSLLSPQPQR